MHYLLRLADGPNWMVFLLPFFEQQAITEMIEGGGTAAAVNGTTNYSPGKFMLLTPGAQKNGCLPGWYKVVFLKTLPVGKDGKPLSDEELENLESPPQTKSVIPEEYTDVDTSGIKVQVLPKNNQPFIFELSSK